MRTLRRTMAGAAVAVALLSAMAVPAVAMATPGSGVAVHASETSPAVKPTKRAIFKYRTIAQSRRKMFDYDVRVLQRRLNRLAAIRNHAKARGADVTTVTVEIQSARMHIAQAKQLEIIAVAKTKLVPYSADRTAAWAEATAAWTAARAELKLARADKQAAARDLWAIVKQLKIARKYHKADFK